MRGKILTILLISLLSIPKTRAQQPYYFSQNTVRAVIENGDTVTLVKLPTITVYGKFMFRNKEEEKKYWRLVRDVKKTLPFAKIVRATLLETYEYIETLPNEKARQKHLERMQHELFEDYKPILKKLTYSQGRLLIKLIDRECNQSSYALIKAYLGGFAAGFWQGFGRLFGVSLKSEWDPYGKDQAIERICDMVEMGVI